MSVINKNYHANGWHWKGEEHSWCPVLKESSQRFRILESLHRYGLRSREIEHADDKCQQLNVFLSAWDDAFQFDLLWARRHLTRFARSRISFANWTLLCLLVPTVPATGEIFYCNPTLGGEETKNKKTKTKTERKYTDHAVVYTWTSAVPTLRVPNEESWRQRTQLWLEFSRTYSKLAMLD